MHGMSWVPLIKNEPVDWRKAFIYEYFCDPKAVQTPTIIGLRTEQYSYMTYDGVWDTYELYDIKVDPDQKNNLLGHIDFGQRYGTFLDHLKRQDPELFDRVRNLDDQMHRSIRETQ